MTTPAAASALSLALLMAAIAVPLNTIFGVGCALAIVRGKVPGSSLVVLAAMTVLGSRRSVAK